MKNNRSFDETLCMNYIQYDTFVLKISIQTVYRKIILLVFENI